MYDTMLRFSGVSNGPPYNFNNPMIYETFVDDMDYIAENYFSHKNYFKINGRPVLWIYIVRDFTGNYEKVISKIRNNMQKKGFNVYIVADVVFWNYNIRNIKSFDAISLYSAYAGRPQNTADFAERLKFLYMSWKVIAQFTGKDFIPGAIPAYDDTCLSSERDCIPPLSGSGEDFNYLLRVISRYIEPINIAPNLNQVTIATFNENQEGSAVEPSKEYGYERIRQIPLIFGLE